MKGPGKIVRQALSSITKRAATTHYPFVKSGMPKSFRGRLLFSPEKCIGCRLCMRDCPSDAITIRKIGEKRFECDVDLGKCIYCAQCVDTCPKKALEATPEFELAQTGRDQLKITFHAPEPPAQPTTPAPEPEVKA